MFRRKKNADGAASEPGATADSMDGPDDLYDGDRSQAGDDIGPDSDGNEAVAGSQLREDAAAGSAVSGPWDVSDAPAGEERIDFGAVQVSAQEGLEVQVQADQNTGQVSMVTLVVGQAAAQVQVFAAPKSSGIWDEIRAEIAEAIKASGGQAREVEGPFGVELDARVVPSGGGSDLAPARFVGVDGPRWFLRAILIGNAAAQGSGAAAIEDALRGLVVVRGGLARAPREPLPMRLPGTSEQPPAVSVPNPFERGPEITEIR